jgi:hypothetical protein
MGAIELRDKLIQLINTADEKYLKVLNAFVEQRETSDSDIVAYTMDGTPLSQEEYIENNNQAVASFKKGDFKTQSQMREKFGA